MGGGKSNKAANQGKPKEYSKEHVEKLKKKRKMKAKADAENIICVYKKYIDKFCEIAEREISTLDEWGDENWDSLPRLKKECIFRIARQINKDTHKKITNYFSTEDWFTTSYRDENTIEVSHSAPLWAQRLFNEDLDQIFLEYHKKRKSKGKGGKIDYNRMSGNEFENYIGGILIGLGYNASGTPKTGDQGADLIASKGDKVFVIQVKRHSKSVGNRAIQEVVAAKKYYEGNVAVVITSSSFTSSAKKLARKNKVILVDKLTLSNIDYLLGS